MTFDQRARSAAEAYSNNEKICNCCERTFYDGAQFALQDEVVRNMAEALRTLNKLQDAEVTGIHKLSLPALAAYDQAKGAGGG